MIGYLRGRVEHTSPDHVILLDVRGVGYEVSVTASTAFEASSLDDIQLFVHTQMRDDAIVLFGFLSLQERDVFRQLISVSGIGPAIALATLGLMRPEEVATVIARSDTDALSKVPGIGKKTAARLILELAGKLVNYSDIATVRVASSSVGDVVEMGLRELGFSVQEIREGITGVELPDDEGRALTVALKAMNR